MVTEEDIEEGTEVRHMDSHRIGLGEGECRAVVVLLSTHILTHAAGDGDGGSNL